MAVTGPVTLEILDAAGKPIRRFSSDDKPPFTLESLRQTLADPNLLGSHAQRSSPTRRACTASCGTCARLRRNRQSTAIRSQPIPHDTPREPLGPLVLPGRYTVRLTAQGKILTAPLNVIMDPRVITPAAGLRQQYEVESRLLAMINESFEAQAELSGLDHQLDALSKQAQGSVADAVSALREKVSALLGSRARTLRARAFSGDAFPRGR